MSASREAALPACPSGARHRRRRLIAAAAALALVIVAGLQLAPPDAWFAQARVADPRSDPAAHAESKRGAEIRARFDQAAAMLHARQFEHAAVALHRVLELAPALPEAHANMGFAMLGLQRYGAALDFFRSALDLRPTQANAYYGLAMAAEGAGDLETALGAMRTFLHFSAANDPYRARARAALWEWEHTLGRHDAAAGDARPDNAPVQR